MYCDNKVLYITMFQTYLVQQNYWILIITVLHKTSWMSVQLGSRNHCESILFPPSANESDWTSNKTTKKEVV